MLAILGRESGQINIYCIQSNHQSGTRCCFLGGGTWLIMVVWYNSRFKCAVLEFIAGHFIGRIMGRTVPIKRNSMVYAIRSIELPAIFGG